MSCLIASSSFFCSQSVERKQHLRGVEEQPVVPVHHVVPVVSIKLDKTCWSNLPKHLVSMLLSAAPTRCRTPPRLFSST